MIARPYFLRAGILEAPRTFPHRGRYRATLAFVCLLLVAFTLGVGLGARLERSKHEREIKSTQPQAQPSSEIQKPSVEITA